MNHLPLNKNLEPAAGLVAREKQDPFGAPTDISEFLRPVPRNPVGVATAAQSATPQRVNRLRVMGRGDLGERGSGLRQAQAR